MTANLLCIKTSYTLKALILKTQVWFPLFSLPDDVYRSKGKVLVHCVAGVSRSATLTIAYIMQRSELSMMEAFKLVKRKRHIVAPNFNFMGQLMELERRLQEGSTPRDLTVDLGIDLDRQKSAWMRAS